MIDAVGNKEVTFVCVPVLQYMNQMLENKLHVVYHVDDIYKSQMLGWIIWNFIEQFVMITYIYRTVIKFIKEKIKTELILFFVIWYIYSTICSFIDYYHMLSMKESNK